MLEELPHEKVLFRVGTERLGTNRRKVLPVATGSPPSRECLYAVRRLRNSFELYSAKRMPETLAFFAQIEELARTLLAATPEVGKKLFW